MEHALGTVARPLRVAIIGAGPAGFYAAEALLKQPSLTVSIDIFNHFPYPYGLVRDGVPAPTRRRWAGRPWGGSPGAHLSDDAGAC